MTRWRKWAVILLVALLTAAAAPRPASAQASYGVQLFTQIYRLILDEALEPPQHAVLLGAAIDGMRKTLRAYGVSPDFTALEATADAEADFRATTETLEHAMNLAAGAAIEIVYGAVRAMVEAVGDPNSVFLAPPDMARFLEQQETSFVGIGIQLTLQGQQVVIIAVLENSPAARAGILPDDIIVSVDGALAEGRSLDEVRRMIVGSEGSPVTLGLLRPSNGQHLTISVTRERIVQQIASARMLAPGVGYLRLTQFTSGSADQVAELLRQLVAQGAKGLVLDLRNNPGGLLTESIDITSHFLEDGLVISVQGSHDHSQTFVVRPREPKFTSNIVILVNRGSASASEIVAGALQDAGVKLVGDRTYGKATVQSVYPFRDGSGLRLTVARYLTRSGRDIRGLGLTPDIGIPLSGTAMGSPEDAQLQRAVALVGEMIRTVARAAR